MIISPDNITQVISDIAKRYGIEETSREAMERFSNGKFPKLAFIAKASVGYFRKTISDNDLPVLLQNNLEITKDVAIKLSESIRKEIIPLIKEGPEPQFTQPSAENNPPPVRNPEESFTAEKFDGNITNEKINIGEKPIISREMKGAVKEKNTIKKPSVPKQVRGPDTYREPIE